MHGLEREYSRERNSGAITTMNGSWFLLAAAAGFALGAVVLTVRGFGVARIGWLNFSRLRELDRQRAMTGDPAARAALDAVIASCQELRRRWILQEDDLRPAEGAQRLVREIAAHYHPDSPAPLAEARLGDALDAFQELKSRLLALVRLPGVRTVTQFRLRHLLLLSRAWQKKEAWLCSPAGRAAAKYRLFFAIKWGYTFLRALDLSFWTLKMLGVVLKDGVMKILLIRWYLIVGELAIGVYGGDRPEAELTEVDIEKKLEDLPDIGPPPELTGEAGAVAQASRKTILLHAAVLDGQAIGRIVRKLVADIARVHHPESSDPLYEIRLYSLIVAAARISDALASLKNRPVWGRLLELKVAHLLWMKDAADYMRESEVLAWVQKTRLRQVVKYSNWLYKVIQKKHPGLLVKDLAFTLVQEGAKRWLAIYAHDKIALEADRLYREEAPVPQPEPALPAVLTSSR
jgi:hypothetical protein